MTLATAADRYPTMKMPILLPCSPRPGICCWPHALSLTWLDPGPAPDPGALKR